MPQETPRTLGSYQLLKELGRGGQGVVWLAFDPILKRKVALKVLRAGQLDVAELRVRFEREAEVSSRLSHPGICSVHALEEVDGILFIVMEWIDGVSLREWSQERRTEGREGTARTVQLVERLARALHVAHEAGLVHRDVKPENVLVKEGDEPIVLDFGLARTDEAGMTVTLTGDIIGTPAYMAPEQVDGTRGRADRRTDVFALGVVLWEALTGARPFDGSTRDEVYRGILSGDPGDPRRSSSYVNKDLAIVCQTCLEKDPARRYATAADAADDLRRVRMREPIRARPAGPWLKLRRWAQRRPAVASLLVATFVGLLGFALWSQAKSRELEIELDRSLRLNHLMLARELLDDVPDTWPAVESSLPVLDQWITTAGSLLAQRSRWARELQALTAQGLRDDAFKWWIEFPAERQRIREYRRLETAAAAWLAIRNHGERADGLRGTLKHARTEKERLTEIVNSHRTRRFQAGGDDQVLDMCAELLDKLELLGRPETGALARVERRREFVAELYARTVTDHRAAWDEAIADSEEEELKRRGSFKHPKLVPQVGLVPLGRDPHSGLHEFLHLETHEGPIPQRGPDGIPITDETGLILVMLWSRDLEVQFHMGASALPTAGPSHDPLARPEEGPVHPMDPKMFLISKYEMTQGQWLRATGRNPSLFGPACEIGGRRVNLRHPVESVSYTDCDRVLLQLGLRLPTEAQHEYAMRGGTRTPWTSGTRRADVRHVANVSDRSTWHLAARGIRASERERWSDGWPAHARVDEPAFAPNDFGLHQTGGNVWEWCRDRWGSLDRQAGGGSGERLVEGDPPGFRPVRGGSFTDGAEDARCARRRRVPKGMRKPNIGVRPIWEVRFSYDPRT